MPTQNATVTKLPSPQYVVVDGLRVRYATGGSATGRPVLLTSPWPESIIAFGAIWDDLADVAPLLAVDLPGFGKSEGRPDIMNPRAMGSFLVRLAKEFSLDAPHAVCPDVGTSAVLYAAADHDRPFTSLTVGGGAMDERLVAGTLKDIVEAPDTKAFEGTDGGDVVAAAVPQLRETPPSEDDLRDYRESYAGRSVREVHGLRPHVSAVAPAAPRAATDDRYPSAGPLRTARPAGAGGEQRAARTFTAARARRRARLWPLRVAGHSDRVRRSRSKVDRRWLSQHVM